MPTLPNFLLKSSNNSNSSSVTSAFNENPHSDVMNQRTASSSSLGAHVTRSKKNSQEEESSLETKDTSSQPAAPPVDEREVLLSNLKIQVKQLMEEAVTRKFIHEESCSVISLCDKLVEQRCATAPVLFLLQTAVEACLMCGLRRQVGGFFRALSSWDLLCKVAASKQCPAALMVHQRVLQEQPHYASSSSTTLRRRFTPLSGSGTGARRGAYALSGPGSSASSTLFSSNDSLLSTLSAGSAVSLGTSVTNGGGFSPSSTLQRIFRTTGDSFSSSTSSVSELQEQAVENARLTYNATQSRYLWIRIALCEKYLCDVVEFVRLHPSKYYTSESVIADPCYGGVFYNLLAGPSALDYTKMRTGEQLWTDPPADELVQRHQLQCGTPRLISRNDSSSNASTSSTGPALPVTMSTAAVSPAPPEHTHRRNRFLLRYNSPQATASLPQSTASTEVAPPVTPTSSPCRTNSPPRDDSVTPELRRTSAAGKLHRMGRADAIRSLSSLSHRQCSDTYCISPSTLRRYQQRKPSLLMRRLGGKTFSGDTNVMSAASATSTPHHHHSAKEYIEALHQNAKSVNIYGKNNVRVQSRDDAPRLPGYLSLHSSTTRGIFVQWIPNQLMNAAPTTKQHNRSRSSSHSSYSFTGAQGKEDEEIDTAGEVNVYWEYALTIYMEDIVYIHCHHSDHGGTVVFVDLEGVQRPPLHFPMGSSHVTSFLTHMEAALLPHGKLEPPVWKQEQQRRPRKRLQPGGSTVSVNTIEGGGVTSQPTINGTNKPTRARASSMEYYPHQSEGHLVPINKMADSGEQQHECTSRDNEDEPMDYVFRVIYPHRAGARNNSGQTVDSSAVEPWLEIVTSQEHEREGDQLAYNASWFSCQPQLDTERLGGPTKPSSRRRIHTHRRGVSEPEPNPQRVYIQQLCHTMRKQILSRAFFGWLSYCRQMRNIRQHLHHLVRHDAPYNFTPDDLTEGTDNDGPLTEEIWRLCMDDEGRVVNVAKVLRSIYLFGCVPSIRKEVWPFLLQHHSWHETKAERDQRDALHQQDYERTLSEWLAVEAIVRYREYGDPSPGLPSAGDNVQVAAMLASEEVPSGTEMSEMDSTLYFASSYDDSASRRGSSSGFPPLSQSTSRQSLPSPTSSFESGSGIYSEELLRQVSLNSHRIEKDVARCDRSYEYFSRANFPLGIPASNIVRTMGSGTGNRNLEKLRNIMCTYVWSHLAEGYVQGMCDLAAPLLVLLDDESLAHACFTQLMSRMRALFITSSDDPQHSGSSGNAMDQCFSNMRALLQVVDPGLLEHMHRTGDYSHFYFSYRWFLLNFKREFKYNDVFWVWETIWAAGELTTSHFPLFVALAMLLTNRDIIVENNMDFTDIIRFFNERAEKHDTPVVLREARSCVQHLQLMLLGTH